MKKVIRQSLLWIPPAVDKGNGAAPRAPFIPFTDAEPNRVWTLYHYRDEKAPPSLPYTPVHHVNAFMEDYVHDWNVFRGTFWYNSRALDGNVWLLLEWT